MIGENLGVTKNVVQHNIKQLEKAGYIYLKEHKHSNGSSTYTKHWKKKFQVDVAFLFKILAAFDNFCQMKALTTASVFSGNTDLTSPKKRRTGKEN